MNFSGIVVSQFIQRMLIMNSCTDTHLSTSTTQDTMPIALKRSKAGRKRSAGCVEEQDEAIKVCLDGLSWLSLEASGKPKLKQRLIAVLHSSKNKKNSLSRPEVSFSAGVASSSTASLEVNPRENQRCKNIGKKTFANTPQRPEEFSERKSSKEAQVK